MLQQQCSPLQICGPHLGESLPLAQQIEQLCDDLRRQKRVISLQICFTSEQKLPIRNIAHLLAAPRVDVRVIKDPRLLQHSALLNPVEGRVLHCAPSPAERVS